MKLLKLLLVMLIPVMGISQTLKVGDDLTIVHYNADWNSANDVDWFNKINDCKRKTCNIAEDTKAQSKHEIVVVPTIVIFLNGEEIKRFQADISFTMKATLKEVQGFIDETIMNEM